MINKMSIDTSFILLEAVLLKEYGWNIYPKYGVKDNDDDLYESDDQLLWQSLYAIEDNNKKDICRICLDEMNGKCVLQTNCGHKYCYECILTTIKFKRFKCPSCNKEYKKITSFIRNNLA